MTTKAGKVWARHCEIREVVSRDSDLAGLVPTPSSREPQFDIYKVHTLRVPNDGCDKAFGRLTKSWYMLCSFSTMSLYRLVKIIGSEFGHITHSIGSSSS